jgi:hypothetical protein
VSLDAGARTGPAGAAGAAAGARRARQPACRPRARTVCERAACAQAGPPTPPPPPLAPRAPLQKRVCPRGNDCPFAHSMTEYFLHPSRYRTQMCNDGAK